jgi:3D-(3,5/4)-trihydroxycyclohexane-1,2-dione acylhydrolase (decyclizing)
VDFAANAASLGAIAVRARTREELAEAVKAMPSHDRTSVVVVETDYSARVPGYESWWDVPVSEVSEVDTVDEAYRSYVAIREKERYFL